MKDRDGIRNLNKLSKIAETLVSLEKSVDKMVRHQERLVDAIETLVRVLSSGQILNGKNLLVE